MEKSRATTKSRNHTGEPSPESNRNPDPDLAQQHKQTSVRCGPAEGHLGISGCEVTLATRAQAIQDPKRNHLGSQAFRSDSRLRFSNLFLNDVVMPCL